MNIHSVNLLYIIVGEVDGSIEEKNGNKYLTFASTDKKKKVLEKYTELWNNITSLVECSSVENINNKPGKYGKDYMKIKFNLDDNLPSNKILKLHNLTIVVRSVFEKYGKYYPQVFLEECLYDLQMLEYNREDLSEGIYINKINASKECGICHYWYFLDKVLNMNHIFAIVVLI